MRNSVQGRDPIQRSTGTVDKEQAEAWTKQAAEQLWRQVRLGIEPDKTWEEALVRWIKERQGKTTIDEVIVKFKWLHPYLGGKKLIEISRSLVVEISSIKAEQTSPPTTNRYVTLISAVLRLGVNVWEWLEKAPVFHKFPEKRNRIRFLNYEEAERLLNELPLHQREITIFGIATGLRQRNILELEWSEVDLVKRHLWVKAEQFKNRNAFGLPLSNTAYEVLVKQIGKHPKRVFTYKGEPINQINTKAWRKALKRAGIEDFRWHDLRHTFAT